MDSKTVEIELHLEGKDLAKEKKEGIGDRGYSMCRHMQNTQCAKRPARSVK